MMKRRRARDTNSNLGFTLMELMVVALILAVLSVTIAPYFSGSLQEEILSAASRELVQVMTLASSQAVITNTPHRLRFDPSSRRYWLEMLGEGPGGGGKCFLPPGNLPDAAGQLNEKLSLRIVESGDDLRESHGGASPWRHTGTGSPETVVFYPDRTADAKAILLSDEEGFTVALEVKPNTSRVRITHLGIGESLSGGR